jgi:hypothetical protein
VIVCVIAEFTESLPKFKVDALTPNLAEDAPHCSEKVLVAPPSLAVNVAVWLLLAAATAAVNPALVAPAATVTDDGTVTIELLLARATVVPPLGAAADSVTVHASVPAPVIVPVLQEIPFSVGCVGCADPVSTENAAICITHGPDSANVAAAVLLPAVVAALSSTRSESAVSNRVVYPLPVLAHHVATVFDATISSFAPLVVAAPLLVLVLLPAFPAATSRLATP